MLYFLLSTLVLTLYIDVVLSLSIKRVPGQICLLKSVKEGVIFFIGGLVGI